jgi:hypothetical protein
VGSIFLLPTAAYGYAIVSSLLSYTFALVCAPGALQRRVSPLMLLTGAWLSVLIGLPSNFSSGIINATATNRCMSWFGDSEVQGRLCASGWLTYTTLIAIGVVIINFFGVVVMLSLWFEYQSTEQQPGASCVPAPAPYVSAGRMGEYEAPLNAGEMDKRE